jgi:protein required for attachment to host cells
MSWILIANRAGARIVDKQANNFSLVETIAHEQGRLRDRDIDSDKQGRSFDRVGGGRHALSASESAHEHDAKAFAQQLADKLRAERNAKRFERLVLVAEPHFLGLLRDALDSVTARTVIASVSKDLSRTAMVDLGAHLPELPQVVL